VTDLRSVQPRAQVNGNTIQVIVVMPLMAIAISPTGCNKLTIGLLEVQVIGHPRHLEQMAPIN
jgi:hypothetical protein